MYTLYSMQRSGNSYKVRLALAQLGLPYRLVEIDILQGESRTPEFLAKNPNGQVPLLEEHPLQRFGAIDAIVGPKLRSARYVPEDRVRFGQITAGRGFEQRHLAVGILRQEFGRAAFAL